MNAVLSRAMVLGAVTVLSACGGGGGGGTTTSSTTGGVVSGTAAKGLLQNALVTAYCGVKASSNAIGTTTTDASGNYSLTLTQTCAQPVEIVVSAKLNANGSVATTMLDEIAGQITAPTNLTMRAFVPAASTTVSLPVTPFTDMAAAIVENSIGTTNALSSSMVSNANTAIITNVLGGNAGLLTAQPLPPSAYSAGGTTSDQQQLIVLLSGISQAAQTASGATPGDQVQTVLNQLALQAKQTIPTVTSSGFTVSASADTTATSGSTATPLATINGGLTALATSTNTTNLGAAAATIKTSVTNVQTAVVQTSTTQIATTQALPNGTVTTPTSAVQDAISAARTLFAAIRTNLLALVNPQQTGFLQNKSTALTNDVNGLALGGTYHFTDILLAANRATALLAQTNQAVANSSTPQGATAKSDVYGNYFRRVTTEGTGELKCNSYYTAGAGLTASVAPLSRTAPVAGNGGNPVTTCNMYIFSGDNTHMMQFQVKSPASKPTSGTNTFNYVNRIRTWADPTCTDTAQTSPTTCSYTDTNEVQGTLIATLDSNLAVTSMTIANQPVIPFQSTAASTISLNYTASQVNSVNTLTFSGGLSSGALKYGFASGSQLVITDTSTPTVSSGTIVANLIGQIQTGAFQYDGTFGLNGGSSGGTVSSGTISFGGKISTLASGVATLFLEGSLTGDATAKTVAFSGKITNGSSVNSLSITGDTHIAGQQGATVTILTPGYTITATGTNYDNVATPSTMTVTSSDGTKIDVSRANGTSTVNVKSSAGTTIGSVTGNQVNFNDGSYIVLN